jgi:predicted P-loop ATPase
LLVDYLGAEDTPYTRAVTRKTLCAAVNRVYKPGIKFDHLLVMNGPQGIGKSTLIAKLGGEWYSDSLSISDMQDKTSAEKLQGYWLLEIGELAGIKRADEDKIKAFISRQDDKYRASFGRRVTPHPRQCIFFGTTNAEDGYLRDSTGNRRFWTVKSPGTGKYSSWQLIEDDVKQIWAEVLIMVEKGEKLYLDPTMETTAQSVQRSALESDPREGMIQRFLETPLPDNWGELNEYQRRDYLSDPFSAKGTIRRDTVSTVEILIDCLGRNKQDLRKSDGYDIGLILQKLNWRKNGKRHNDTSHGRQWTWVREE